MSWWRGQVARLYLRFFFNEKLFGGLVALNSLRNGGRFDQRLEEMLSSKCPDDALAPPIYGFDDLDEEEYKDKVFVPGQSNNAYIFPGFGLGLVISGAIRVHDDMLLAASEALAGQVSEENFAQGLIYPPLSNIRKISAQVAANVAAKAYDLGVATRLPRPENLVKHAESCMYSPVYRNYR
ncbi:hypothetical protein FF2_003359 [Malus domestica]